MGVSRRARPDGPKRGRELALDYLAALREERFAAFDDWAAEHRVDLIVVGTHGLSGLSRLLLGSVSERTVRHAPCSVLVMRRPTKPEDDASEGG